MKYNIIIDNQIVEQADSAAEAAIKAKGIVKESATPVNIYISPATGSEARQS